MKDMSARKVAPVAQKESSGRNGNEDEIEELERQLSEAKKKKQIEDLESEIAALKSSSRSEGKTIIVRGKPVASNGKGMSKGAKIGIGFGIAFGVILLLALIGQSESGDTEITGSAVEDQSAVVEGCFAAPQAMVDAIATGTEDDTFLEVTKAAAWGQTDEGYFVAAEVKQPAGDFGQGVWASYDPLARGGDKLGLVLAVNDVAKRITVYPDASGTKAAIQADDPGVDKALACLNQ